jgi:arginyl-tRNA synthetase
MLYAWEKIKQNIAANLSKILNKEITADKLVLPPNPEMGDLGLPLFDLAKETGKNPAELAREIAEKYPAEGEAKAKAAGPYLNFILEKKYLAENILAEIAEQKEEYGKNNTPRPSAFAEATADKSETPLDRGELRNEKIVLEFSNGNTHKELHIGHLRNICYGDSLTKILKASGASAIPVSYINDFGIHVAKTLWDLDSYVKENLGGKNIEDFSEAERGYLLGKIYVDASQKEKANPDLTAEIGAWKQKIENREGEEYALWQKTRLWSIANFAAVYADLDIKFQDTLYESELVEEGKKIVEELLAKNILKKSEGAIIADLTEYKLDVLVFVRSNGTATYSVADLALAREKERRYSPDESIVIVDIRQELYFKQLFKILELSGAKEKFLHLGYDFVKLPSGMMSSRTGNVITYQELKEEILNKCVAETKKRHEDWDEEKIKDNAKKIGLGAIKFEMLKVGAKSIITFDIEKALSLEGYTSAYIQYAYARIRSILRKNSPLERGGELPLLGGVDAPRGRGGLASRGVLTMAGENLSETKEIGLIKKMALYPEIVEAAGKSYDPSEIAKYVYEVAQLLNDYYHAVPVLQAEEEIKNARLALLSSVAQVIQNGLALLGIETVEEM